MRNQSNHVPKSESESNSYEDKGPAGNKLTTTRITRRSFLGVSAAVGSYAVLSHIGLGEVDASDAITVGAGEGVLPGVVDRVELPDTLYVRNEAGLVTVRFPSSAKLWRSGPAQLQDFVAGDRVVAQGKWVAGIFVATRLLPALQLVNLRIMDRNGDVLTTNGRTVRITRRTVFIQGQERKTPIPELPVGTDITALGRVDPLTDELVAGKIGLSRNAGWKG